jgi:hypothetical protein
VTTRCSCPGLGVSPDCLIHMYDPSEDEPTEAPEPRYMETLDESERRGD